MFIYERHDIFYLRTVSEQLWKKRVSLRNMYNKKCFAGGLVWMSKELMNLEDVVTKSILYESDEKWFSLVRMDLLTVFWIMHGSSWQKNVS